MVSSPGVAPAVAGGGRLAGAWSVGSPGMVPVRGGVVQSWRGEVVPLRWWAAIPHFHAVLELVSRRVTCGGIFW